MNRANIPTQISDQQVRRAAVHEALGDPLRLAIADMLLLGDASPKDLAAAFDIPTNLLAHHLSVLESADVLTRRRSEGDARRTYLTLGEGPEVAALLRHRANDPPPARRVVFVCTHNSARSQLAAAEWTRVSRIPVTSAGTHPARTVHQRAIDIGRRHRLALAKRRTSHVDDVLAPDDLVVAVCDQAHEEMRAASSGSSLHWSIPDPVRVDSDEAFEAAYAEIRARVHRLAHILVEST